MNIRKYTQSKCFVLKINSFTPSKRSELIVPAPFRAGVIRENQFAEWVNKRILKLRKYFWFNDKERSFDYQNIWCGLLQ